MKIKFYCDNHCTIHSKKEIIYDLEKDLGLTEEEWRNMSEDEQIEFVKDSFEVSYWWEEVE